MQKIKVTNFQALRDVEIEVNDFLMLLGEQASGKSTIGKLIFFFKSLRQDLVDFIYDSLDSGTLNDDTDLRKLFWPQITRKFYNYFGSTRHLVDFEIVYTYGNKKRITLTLHPDKSLNIDFQQSEFFTSLFFGDMQNYVNEVRNYASQTTPIERRAFRRAGEDLEAYVANLFEDALDPLFIPAGRNISVNFPDQFRLDFFGGIRSDLARRGASQQDASPAGNVQSVDLHLMVQFLYHIEQMKERFKSTDLADLIQERSNLFKDIDVNALKAVIEHIQKVLKGKYVYGHYGEVIYVDDDTYVHLNNASSGQQEAIRILQDLFLVLLDGEDAFRVIEEPEAHLYPMAQKHLIEAMAIVLNRTDSQVIITTHSPYILSLVNNLLFATRVATNNPPVSTEIEQVIPRISWLDPDKTSVYLLKNGKCESVLNGDIGLIDQNALDEISEELGADFEGLYELHSRAFA